MTRPLYNLSWLWNTPASCRTSGVCQGEEKNTSISQAPEQSFHRRLLGIPNLHSVGLNYHHCQIYEDLCHFEGIIWSYHWFHNPISGHMILHPDPLPFHAWTSHLILPVRQSLQAKPEGTNKKTSSGLIFCMILTRSEFLNKITEKPNYSGRIRFLFANLI